MSGSAYTESVRQQLKGPISDELMNKFNETNCYSTGVYNPSYFNCQQYNNSLNNNRNLGNLP